VALANRQAILDALRTAGCVIETVKTSVGLGGSFSRPRADASFMRAPAMVDNVHWGPDRPASTNTHGGPVVVLAGTVAADPVARATRRPSDGTLVHPVASTLERVSGTTLMDGHRSCSFDRVWSARLASGG